MSQVNHIDILKASWGTTWRKKYLWFFGFFSVLELTILFSPLAEYIPEKTEDKARMVRMALNFATERRLLVGLLIGALLVVALIFWIIRTWGRAALIKVSELEDQGSGANLAAGFGFGKKYFGKVFVINLLINIFLAGLAIVLLIPASFVLNYAGEVYGLSVIMVAVLIFVPLAVIASFVKTYALIYGVIAGLGVAGSIESAYQVFRNNQKSSLIMLLYLTLISLVIGAIVNFIEYFLNPTYLIFGELLYDSYGKTGLDIVFGIKYLINMAVLFMFLSIFGVLYQVSWIRFFRQIAGRKTVEMEKEEGVRDKEVPEPEGVNLDLLEK